MRVRLICRSVAGRSRSNRRSGLPGVSGAKCFFGLPEFHRYALSDGIGMLLSKLGRFLNHTGMIY